MKEKGWIDKMIVKIQYREATESDIPKLAELHNELVYFIQQQTKDAYWNFEELFVDDTVLYLKEFYNSPKCKIHIAVYEGEIVGFIMGEVIRCHLPISKVSEVGYISAAYIREEYQRKGILKGLEERLTKFFKTLGIQYVELNYMYEHIGAKKCWEALGYDVFRVQTRKKIP
jgi:ribosomal protein S18 acetylase RimI-like enzyme